MPFVPKRDAAFSLEFRRCFKLAGNVGGVMTTALQILTFPLRFLDFLAFEAHVVGMRKSRNVPQEEIEKYLVLWRNDCAYYELALSKRQVYEHDEKVPIPPMVQKPDYEFEVGCLLQETTRLNMSLEEAEVFFKKHCSLTILNDFSARDFQEKDRQLGLGVARSKSIMGKAIGPRFVPAKELDLPGLELVLRVNGEERTRTTYGTCTWTFPRIISHLSQQNIILEAGTLIGSGTVGGGSIAEHGGKYPWLKKGDVVEMEAVGIGILRNMMD
jgi:2-keto-4-pentenoate hydratase/2-oxohepta-3-ene-1,7-dioic acid hydratase in catechol pathway